MGSREQSRSKSGPTTIPGQERLWQEMGTEWLPMSRGEPSTYTRMLEQSMSDQAGKNMAMLNEQMVGQNAQTGIGMPAPVLEQTGQNYLDEMIKAIGQSRHEAQKMAMQIISGVPLISQKSETQYKGVPTWEKMLAGIGTAAGAEALKQKPATPPTTDVGITKPAGVQTGTETTPPTGETAGGPMGNATPEQKKQAMEIYKDASPEERRKMEELVGMRPMQEGDTDESREKDWFDYVTGTVGTVATVLPFIL